MADGFCRWFCGTRRIYKQQSYTRRYLLQAVLLRRADGHLADVCLADVNTQILQVSCEITAPPLCGFCRYRSAFSFMFCTIPRISSFHRSTNHWGAKGFAFFPWDRTHSKTGIYWEEVKDMRVTSFSSQSVIS